MIVHITLHLSQRSLQVEALWVGLLDSGCSRTVVSRLWYDEYLKTLSAAELEKLYRVAKSPLAAETMELAEATDAGYLAVV